MTPPSIPCQAQKPDGSVCSALATVMQVSHTYETRMDWTQGGAFSQFLIATRYELECPRCGKWEKTVEADK